MSIAMIAALAVLLLIVAIAIAQRSSRRVTIVESRPKDDDGEKGDHA